MKKDEIRTIEAAFAANACGEDSRAALCGTHTSQYHWEARVRDWAICGAMQAFAAKNKPRGRCPRGSVLNANIRMADLPNHLDFGGRLSRSGPEGFPVLDGSPPGPFCPSDISSLHCLNIANQKIDRQCRDGNVA